MNYSYVEVISPGREVLGLARSIGGNNRMTLASKCTLQLLSEVGVGMGEEILKDEVNCYAENG